MRVIALLLAISPSFVFADTIVARIAPTDVTVFTQGAEVTRKGLVTLPAGIHDIVIPDMRPTGGGQQTPEITLPGATVISEKWQDRNSTLQVKPDTAEFKAAKTALDNAQDAVTAVNDEIATNLLVESAANAQIAFLKSLTTSDTLPDGIDTLRELSQMISEETLKAHKTIQQAGILARKLTKGLPDLQDAVAEAQRGVDALLPASKAFAQMTLTVTVPSETTTELSIKYLVFDAGWRPVYDLRLTTGDTPKLVVERGAMVVQNSGERWENVALTLSTVGLGDQPEPSQIRPQRLRISEPAQMVKRSLAASPQADFAGDSSLEMQEHILIEKFSMATADLSGIAAQYSFDYPMSVDTGADFNRVTLGSLDFEAEIEARAIPFYNETAFRMVSFTNTSGERLLPASANLYVDGRLIADTQIQQIVPGAETEIGFGPIHGLRLTRTILNRNEGDWGIISRSNENTETVRIGVENITDKAWAVTLLDRVPFTEQEDLTIDWSATPRPTTIGYKDQRGVLHWNLDVKAGEIQSVKLDTTITWPDGMVLR
jgi:uncharacterized protein (TIGR02231 family)